MKLDVFTGLEGTEFETWFIMSSGDGEEVKNALLTFIHLDCLLGVGGDVPALLLVT